MLPDRQGGKQHSLLVGDRTALYAGGPSPAAEQLVVSELIFAIPGDIATLTGGYGYDRQLLAGLQRLGVAVQHHALPGGFPAPTPAALAETERWFASVPDGSTLLVDGLALGVLEAAAHQHGSRLRLIALCHHPLALESGLDTDARTRLHASEQAALAQCRAVVVTSPRTRSTLIDQFAVPAQRIRVAEPGTLQRGFAACCGDPAQLLTVATLTPRKGHDLLIAALAGLRALPWQARFVGGGHFDQRWAGQLREQVAAAGLQDRIHFVGEREQLHEDYLQADLFVLPSRYEGYGMVFAEALAYGLPIVAARAGAVPDVVPPTAGLLVPPDSVDALQSGLHRLLTDLPQRRALQAGARAAAAALPSWTQCAEQVAGLVRQLQQEPL
jgi:glycosyltransferase involved in cell wall biosynthesis